MYHNIFYLNGTKLWSMLEFTPNLCCSNDT